jgi:hypothetical protein
MPATDKKNSSKFIPNVYQLKEAMRQLPDPEDWPESSYTSAITVNGHDMPVSFKKTPCHPREQATLPLDLRGQGPYSQTGYTRRLRVSSFTGF